jgi:murein DD-endopeptidase MepM/ murein hydrolase activator NlpD
MNKTNKYERRRKRWAAVCAFLVILAMVAGIVFSAFPNIASAASSTELKKELATAQKNRDAAKQQLENVKNNKANVSKEIANIDVAINQAESDIANTEAEIQQSNINIEIKTQELAEAEANCVQYDDNFKTRARVMYENGTGSYIEVLLGSTSFGDFLSRVEMIKEIVDYDKNMLAQLIASRNAISDAKTALEEEKTSLELRQSQLEAKKEELNTRLESRTLLMQQLESDQAEYQKLYDKQAAESAKIEKELKAAAAAEAAAAAKAAAEAAKKNASSSNTTTTTTTTKYTGGKFQWPVPSYTRVSSEYGYRIHPIYNTKKLHAGLDIAAPYGSSVLAAEAGTVTTATYSSGYGNYVIISHGNGIATLYGHNSSLLVKAGDKVTRGQVIAKVGSTGASTGNHCHFEVRVNGSTTNPRAYLS